MSKEIIPTQIRMDKKLIDKIDEYAENHYMSRNGAINFMTEKYLEGLDLMDNLNVIVDEIKKQKEKVE